MRTDTAGDRLTLSDGRRIGVAEFGASAGPPVMYCHGFPASRLDARLAHDAALEVGARVIALDRPGYGLSDFHPDRRIGDWARDVAAAADALGLGRFAMLGVSGGAPYGLACAARLSGRVTALGIVSGLGAMSARADCAEFQLFARSSFWLARTAPRVSAALNFSLAPVLRACPRVTLKLLAARMPPPDRAVLADPQVNRILDASLREAFRQGGAGAAYDLTLYAKPWDFDPRSIGTPAYLWHGEQDTTVPVSIGRRAAAALAGCRTEYFADEGHFSLPVRRMRPILAALLRHAD